MSPAKRWLVCAVLLVTWSAAAGWAQPAVRVTDLNTTREDVGSPFFTVQGFVQLGTNVLFVQDDGIHGQELWKTDGTTGGTVLVKDVCPGACWSFPHGGVVWNGTFYFGADDGVHGAELWKSDGTTAGTTMVTDVYPGIRPSFSSLLVAGGILYLTADDGVHGSELWKTDGTAAGTQLVADLNPGPAGSAPRLWLDTGTRLLLNAEDGVHGREPWISNGTAAGTAMLADVNPGAGSSSSNFTQPWADAAVLPAGGFVFAADDGSHGQEPWISDGTPAGTALLKDINAGTDGSFFFNIVTLGSRLLFRAFDTSGTELWATDGTAAGTGLVKDIYPGGSNSSPFQLTPFNGRVYFEAQDATNGRELWKTDGTAAGTVPVADINPGPQGSFTILYRHELTALGGALYFFADDGVHGVELWKSDGTAAGTALVEDIEPGNGWGFALGYSGLKAAAGRLFFHALSADGYEPWSSDGTAAGTVELKNVSTLASGVPAQNGFLFGPLQDLGGGRLLFPGDDGVTGLEPWVTDGTPAGTVQLGDLTPGADWSSLQAFRSGSLTLLAGGDGLWKTDGTPTGTTKLLPGTLTHATGFLSGLGEIYFTGTDSAHGSELWKTNGTAAGTSLILDVGPGNLSSDPFPLGVLGSSVFFTANVSTFGNELYRTTGVNSVFQVGDLNPGSGSSNPDSFIPLAAVAVFTAEDGTAGRELYVTDGSQAGTGRLKDIQPGAGSSSPSALTRIGSIAIFIADDGTTGRELWKTDGTPAGTVRVKDIFSGPGSSIQSLPTQGITLTSLGSTVYFVADDGVAGAELWKSDGTAAGTVRVKDVRPGPGSSGVDAITLAGNRLYFIADDGAHGRELWVSDGTDAGTRLVLDLVPGPGSPALQQLTALGHLALFSADDGVHGREMWRSDGGAIGTFQVQDIAPGAAPSSPMGFTAQGTNVYFAANDNVTGFELWRVPQASLLTTFSDVPPTHWAWRFIESLTSSGLANGCGNGQYCPERPVTRAETAVFLITAEHGATYVPPPPTGTRFTDVPASHPAAPWIEQLAAEGITSGCGGGQYCPDASLSRAEMAVLMLGAEHGPGYVPPPATGTRFIDVPANYWAARWIEQLAAEGITSGCSGNQFCPVRTVTRAELSIFLTVAFHVPLP